MEFTCKGCQLRHPSCHSECEKYQREKQAHEERKAAERKIIEIEQGLYAQTERKIRAAIRRKKNARKYFTKG